MLSLLDVVSYMKDKESALAFLRSVPKPFRSQEVRLASGYDLPFDADDVMAFVSGKRADLAELVLERTNDINVLYEVSRMDVTSSVVRGICRNYNVPVPLLLDLHLDERKTVKAAARSALARHLGVTISDADELITAFREILYCSEEELTGHLELARRWRYKTTQAAYTLVFERPGGVSEEVRQYVFTTALGLMARDANGLLAKAFVADPRTTVDEIRQLMDKGPGYGTKTAFHKALLARLEPNSHKWLASLVAYSEYDTTAHEPYAVQLNRESALELFKQGGLGAERALQSGKLTNKDIRDSVTSWLEATRRGQSAGSTLSEKAFRHPGVNGELLDDLLVLAQSHLALRANLATNPNLTAEQQLAMLGEDATRREVAANTAISVEAAEAIGQILTEALAGGGDMLSWSNQKTLVALLSNPAVPLDVKGGLPVSVARSGRFDSWLSSKYMATVINSYLDGDAAKWRMFLDLLPEWEGSLRDLCRAVKSL